MPVFLFGKFYLKNTLLLSRLTCKFIQVRQYQAVDGRLHLVFDIAPTESSQNYTRSYYMNGRDYIISGSCDEHIRICCAQTGRRLRDISLEVNQSYIWCVLYIQKMEDKEFYIYRGWGQGRDLQHFFFGKMIAILKSSLRKLPKKII